jgi:hypothetical protein
MITRRSSKICNLLSPSKSLPGDAQVATPSYLTIPDPTIVGVGRTLILIPPLHHFHHILAVKHVLNRARHVHIRAPFNAMPALVHLAA